MSETKCLFHDQALDHIVGGRITFSKFRLHMPLPLLSKLMFCRLICDLIIALCTFWMNGKIKLLCFVRINYNNSITVNIYCK